MLPPRPVDTEFVCRHCGYTAIFGAGRWRYCRPCEQVKRKDRWRRNPATIQHGSKYIGPNDATRARDARRRAWLREGDCTREDIDSVRAATNGCCVYCGTYVASKRLKPVDPRGFDHLVPRSRGGTHTKSNLVVCCWDCNTRKAEMLPDEFMPGFSASMEKRSSAQ